ncbi:MAG: SCO family protein, partial [Pseudomonadota bacterium]
QKLMIGAAALVVVVAVGAGVWVAVDTPADGTLGPSAMNASGSDVGGPFTMTTHEGEEITSEALIDGPTLLYFGYTFCPDVCPFDVQHMADAVDLLAADGIEVTPVFVTVDPERDTEEQLGYFVDAMHPEMIGLRAEGETLKEVTVDYKVYFSRVNNPDNPEAYLLNHTAFTYFQLPGEGVVRIFRNGFPPEETAAEVRRVLEARGLTG